MKRAGPIWTQPMDGIQQDLLPFVQITGQPPVPGARHRMITTTTASGLPQPTIPIQPGSGACDGVSVISTPCFQ